MGKQHFHKIQNKPYLSLPKQCFVGFMFRLVVNIDIKYVIRKLVVSNFISWAEKNLWPKLHKIQYFFLINF